MQALAHQIVQNPAVPRWLLKIDDEHLGRGHAYMDVAAIPSIAAALQQHDATVAAAAGVPALDVCASLMAMNAVWQTYSRLCWCASSVTRLHP